MSSLPAQVPSAKELEEKYYTSTTKALLNIGVVKWTHEEVKAIALVVLNNNSDDNAHWISMFGLSRDMVVELLDTYRVRNTIDGRDLLMTLEYAHNWDRQLNHANKWGISKDTWRKKILATRSHWNAILNEVSKTE